MFVQKRFMRDEGKGGEKIDLEFLHQTIFLQNLINDC